MAQFGQTGQERVGVGVVAIVVLGTALGLAYNFAGLQSKPSFGVAWKGVNPWDQLEPIEALIDTTATVPASDGSIPPAPLIPEADEPRQIQIAGVKRFFDAGAVVLVDARDRELYEQGHIPGAVSLPYEEATPDDLEAIQPGSRAIVTYCDGGSCELSMTLAWDLILQAGHNRVLVFMGGYPEWEAAGYPVESGTAGEHGGAAAAPARAVTADMDDPMGFFGASDALPTIPEMDRPMKTELATVKQFFDAGGALLIDAREVEEYAAGHIPGAVSLPYEQIESDPSRLVMLEPGDKPIIAYCGGGSCEISLTVADALIAAGYRRVLIYTGGFPEWEKAGYPVARDERAATGM